jgi:putative ABC transport system permease protein
MKRLPFEYAVRNFSRSPVRIVLSVGGSALVVLLVLASASFVTGMKRSLRVTGSHRNAIVLGNGSEESIERSEIAMRTATIVEAGVPGIKRRLGEPYVSPEIHLALNVNLTDSDERGSLSVVRGVTSRAYLVHPQVRIVEGRAPQAGNDEIMIGALVASRLGVDDQTITVGQQVWIDDRPWTIVGRFEAPQTVMNAEIWCPLSDVLVISQRDTLSCVVLTLEDADIADVETFAAQRLDLEISVIGEDAYYASLAAFFGPVRMMVLITAGLIALGGVFGGLNTMYAAFASRVREFGTLQVLGYRRTAIVWSLIQESLLMSAIGAIIAITIGLLVIDGVAIRFSMGAFGLIVDHAVVLIALTTGLVLGVIGALPPAIRCLRLPMTEALKTG